MNRLKALFKVRPGEGRVVSLLFLHYFLLGAAFNFTQTAAFTLFLVEFGAQKLPLVYIANAIIASLIAFVYLRLGQRLSFSRLLVANLSFLLICALGFRLGLALTAALWLVFALPVFFQVLLNLANIELWTLSGRLLNLRQGKRLFGLIGAGQWAAIVITGLLIPPLVTCIGTANLLLLAAAGLAGALVLLIQTTHTFSTQLAVLSESTTAEDRVSSSNLLKNRYVILILALVLVAWVEFFVLDNIFYERASTRYPDETQLASFLGLYLSLLGVLALLGNTFLSGAILSRFGERVGLLVLPGTLLMGVGAMTLIVGMPGAIGFLFWLTVLTKLLDTALGYSVDRSAFLILYQPLPVHQRSRVQTTAEGIFQPLASGLAGLALLTLNSLVASTAQLTYALLVVVLTWLGMAFLAGRAYWSMLTRALARRRLGEAELLIVDKSSRVILEQGLHSPYPGPVIYCLDLLEANEPEVLPTYLTGLLEHPAPEVRVDVLNRIERLGLTSMLNTIKHRLQAETSGSVRSAALRTLASLGGADFLQEISHYLRDPDPQMRSGAIVGLLRSGEMGAIASAGEELNALVNSPCSSERAFAAYVLGEARIQSCSKSLLKLLGDADPTVRRAALQAAGKLQNPDLWPLVIENLAERGVRAAAATALASAGASALPEMGAAFAKREQDREVLIRLAGVLARIHQDDAIALLRNRLDFPDEEVRTRILAALSRCGYQPQDTEKRSMIQGCIQAEFAVAAWTLAALSDVGDGEVVALLKGALAAKLGQTRTRLFFLLSFLHDAKTVLCARDNLAHPSAEKRAYAVEVFDILISKDIKRFLLPLLQVAEPNQQRLSLSASYPQPQLGLIPRLREIIGGSDEYFNGWTKACALYAAGRLMAANLSDTVANALDAPDALARETAVWALSRLDRDLLQGHAGQLCNDPGLQAARGIQRGLNTYNGDERMLSTIEKVIILKRVGLFTETPDDILAEVSALLEETLKSAGETIIEKGDLGDCMYIIVDGEVRVHDGERTLNHLREGEVFGEMALLDAEPRVASVTAVTDTLLLRLDQEPFYELMDDRIEFTRGIIRVLSHHLRARVQDLNELRARLETLKQPAEHLDVN